VLLLTIGVSKLDTFILILADLKLAKTLIDEFPCRPHWTKNTREVFVDAKKNIDLGVRSSTT